MQNNVNKNIIDNSSGEMFLSADELGNMNFLSGKQLNNGSTEFTSTKQWTKNMKDIEAEHKNKQDIISEIKRLENKIDIILKKIENENHAAPDSKW